MLIKVVDAVLIRRYPRHYRGRHRAPLRHPGTELIFGDAGPGCLAITT